MAREALGTFTLGLRAKKVDELRAIAARHLGRSPEEVYTLGKHSLIAELSQAANDNPQLARELKGAQAAIAIKPSFYMMILAPKEGARPPISSAQTQLAHALERLNADLRRQEVPTYKDFRGQIVESGKDVAEAQFTWQRIHWYWDPDGIVYKHLYELQFGFAVLDFADLKAMITCHTLKERDHLVNALCEVYPMTLSPLILTKQVLEQIGSFDQVKRAGYFIPERDSNTPSNIVYADENLSIIPTAREEEENPRSQRKQSFYRIPLESIVEQGVGATSHSGKLWISRETPLDTVREYGIKLLEKVRRTLDDMTRHHKYDEVLATLGISSSSKIAAIKPVALRNEVRRLVEQLANMLLKREAERPFTVSLDLVTKGVPSLLYHPLLQLTDPDTGDVAFWRDSEGNPQAVRVSTKEGVMAVEGHPSREEVDLSGVQHPITGALIEVREPLSLLHLAPTPQLHEIALEAIKYISNQIHELGKILCLPFWISANVVHLDIERAFGRAGPGVLGTVLQPTDLRELRQPLQQTVPESEEARVKKLLRDRGEQCVHMDDDNCRSCVGRGDYLCLRSLVARYLDDSRLLRHKGIELCDIQGKGTFDSGEEAIIFGFAKLGGHKGMDGLTLKNTNGRSLFVQVFAQVSKTTFDTVLIISPSTINQDLQEALRFLCGLCKKRLLILDYPPLAKLLLHFEEQAKFDNIDVEQIYRDSEGKSKEPETERG